MTAPRLELRGVESVGLWSHLEDYGIAAAEAQAVELPAEVGLVLLGGLSGILFLENGVHPCAAELAQGLLSIIIGHRRGGKGRAASQGGKERDKKLLHSCFIT